MTEPVAYMYEDHVFNTEKEAVLFKKEFDRYKHDGMLKHVILPLFTADEISDIYRKNNRVEMTQAEFDEFKILKSLNPTADLIAILKTVSNFKYKNLQSRFVCGSIENQTEFATLWLRCWYERLEELIEIAPDMKWFVRSKKQYQPDMDQGISESGYLYLKQGNIYSIEYYEMAPFKDDAKYFDNKDQAEEWCDPSTEAVHLPVEGE